MGETSIEWTDHSINPIRARLASGQGKGHYCEKISPGCKHCYSSRLQPRLSMPQFQEQRGRSDIEHWLDVSKLQEVLRRKTPTKYFWCDMTDMFGRWVPFEWIAACFAVMAATPHHTHQVLTKRADRMLAFFRWLRELAIELPGEIGEKLPRGASAEATLCATYLGEMMGTRGGVNALGVERYVQVCEHTPWPLPNVWLGCSAEDQQRGGERIPLLLDCPAAVRFVSAEPLLGPINLRPWMGLECVHADSYVEPDTNAVICRECDDATHLDWIICGGESGPGARPCDVDWIKSIIAQCAEAGTACFVKQLGAMPGWTIDLAALRAGGPVELAPRIKDRKGGDPSEWPADLRVRQFPETTPP